MLAACAGENRTRAEPLDDTTTSTGTPVDEMWQRRDLDQDGTPNALDEDADADRLLALASALSRRQREVLFRAVEAGPYQIPRQTSIKDHAAELGLSRSMVGEHLQRGEAALLAAWYAWDRGDDRAPRSVLAATTSGALRHPVAGPPLQTGLT